MDSGEDSFNELTSKFKDSLNQIYRIDQLWQDTHKHARAGELIRWNWDLDRVWCELAGDLNPQSDDGKPNQDMTFVDEFNKVNNEIAQNKLLPNKLYELLIKKEIFLRRLQNYQGKGTAYMDADEDTFE